MKQLLALTLITAILLAGCGQPGSASTEAAPPEESLPVESSAYAPSCTLNPMPRLQSEPDPEPEPEPEPALSQVEISEHSVPLSSAPTQESDPPEPLPAPEPQVDETLSEESYLPELRSEYSHETLLTPRNALPQEEPVIQPEPEPEPEPQSAAEIDPALFEEELFRLINQEREAHGQNALGMEDHLRAAAKDRSREVLISLSHTRPDGSAYYTALDEADFDYAGKWHGENVSQIQFSAGAYTSREAAAYMFDQLRASSGHLNNMISENYLQIGIGATVEQDDGMIRIGSAQLFAGS